MVEGRHIICRDVMEPVLWVWDREQEEAGGFVRPVSAGINR